MNVAHAEVLSQQNQAVRSSIDVRKEQVWWHNVALVPLGQAALGPSEPLHNLGLQCQKKRGIRHLRSAVLRETVGIQHRRLLGDASGHPGFSQRAPATQTQTTLTDHKDPFLTI